jgi:hypothetical protein
MAGANLERRDTAVRAKPTLAFSQIQLSRGTFARRRDVFTIF